MRSKSFILVLFCAWLCPAQRANQTGIAHVAFRVSDLEAARAFYQKLGFDQFFEMKQGDRTTEAFLKVNDHQFIELYPRTGPPQPIGLMHVCYESSNLEALHAEFVKRGLAVSEVRKAGAGNLLMTMKDPEDQTIEYTEYLPGSRHFEDRGKHLGAKRVAQLMVGATSPARDAAAMRVFYLDKLGFTEINHGIPARLRMPGDSGQEVDLAAAGPEVKSGIQFGVADVKQAAEILTGLGLAVKATPANNPTLLTVAGPDGAAISFVKAVLPDAAAQEYFDNWPAGMSPTEIGKRVASHFVTSPHQDRQRIIYPEVCAWYGTLTFAHLSGDKELLASAIQRFDLLLQPENAGLIQRTPHVDFSVFGAVPLQIYIENKDTKYLDLGKWFADRQWENPRPDGLSAETRFWIDDMYMETIVQAQAFRATGDPKYLDRSSLEMVAYLDKLQQPNGLFYHEPEVKFYWGRGNGWVAAGMAELLRSLPKDHPRRARILEGYKKMMKSLLEFQGSDGMWRQLIDRSDSWPETSSTGMFAFAMVTGVKNGWLDAATYGPAARRAWLALAGYIDQNADVTSVCEGTNKLDDLDYYINRKRRTGDFHGQAPVLWTASALLR
ncbi:MAG: glycoside hydrolase family 88 protein [Bryobacteraceae bacterium]|jgi:rhamnogalacturonyl hydrolase YesR/catechol 2,3-dioxygenase-like lactoylglutathione lyase family enzyme